MEDKRQKLIIFLLAANLIAVLYFGAAIQKRIERTNNNINSQIASFNNMLSSQSYSIVNDLRAALHEQVNRVENLSFSYRNIDAGRKQATVEIEATLKSVAAGAQIVAFYGPEGGGHAGQAALSNAEGLTYTGAVTLDLSRNYAFDIVETAQDGAQSVLNTQEYSLRLFNEFYADRIAMHSSGTAGGESKSFDMEFSVAVFGLEEYRLTSAQAQLWLGDTLLENKDVTDLLISSADKNLQDHYNLAVASGEIDINMNIAEFQKKYAAAPDGIAQSGRVYYYYAQSVDLKNDFPDMDLGHHADELRLDLVITCADGFSITL